MDLFVRVSNKVAINMYKNLGYIVYRTVLEYYSGDPDEDAFGKYLKLILHVLLIFCRTVILRMYHQSPYNPGPAE